MIPIGTIQKFTGDMEEASIEEVNRELGQLHGVRFKVYDE